eukprot:COSAG01_NODE_1201_length_11274_cov_639.212349_3_plen_74_part_00
MVLNAGSVGSLEVDIPMAHLRTRPITIAVRDVLISVSPNPDVNVKKAQLDIQERRMVRAQVPASRFPLIQLAG